MYFIEVIINMKSSATECPTPKKNLIMEFIGSGNSTSPELGNSSAALTFPNEKILSIDFGFTAYNAFKSRYNKLPDYIYITHMHLDHIGGLQSLFYDAYFSEKKIIKLFTHHSQISTLHKIMGDLESIAAGEAVNFYDTFQLIPVGDTFWLESMKFNVFESRHHSPKFCHGLALKGRFLFTGDTKAIPETIASIASQGEVIFHDISLFNQPSHMTLHELSQYPKNILDRLMFYHLDSCSDSETLKEKGLLCVKNGVMYQV